MMRTISRRLFPALIVLPYTVTPTVYGQSSAANPHDETINAMRGLASINSADQQRIAEWITEEVDGLKTAVQGGEAKEAANAFLQRFIQQFRHQRNSAAFRNQFAAQTAGFFARQFPDVQLDRQVTSTLGRVLIVLDHDETVPGFVAGLQSSNAVARYLSARGLGDRRDYIARDKQKLTDAIGALGQAAVAEKESAALAAIYRALAIPGHVGDVLAAYLSAFDQRLTFKRGSAVIVDGAERDAFDYFSDAPTIGSLNPDQRAELVRRIAVFLRIDAQRYGEDNLPDEERIRVEVEMVAGEAALNALVRGKSAEIANILLKGENNVKARVLEQVYSWVGNPETQAAGELSAAPWSVPVGGP